MAEIPKPDGLNVGKGYGGRVAPEIDWIKRMDGLVNKAHSKTLSMTIPEDPAQGLQIEDTESDFNGGPFYPFVRTTAGWGTNDMLWIGDSGLEAPEDSKVRVSKRSATSPGVLMINKAVRTFTEKDIVDITSDAVWAPDGPAPGVPEDPGPPIVPAISADLTRLLLMRVDSVDPGAALEVNRVVISFHAILPASLAVMPDWKDTSSRIHFPLGWITIGSASSGEDSKLVVEDITWGNESWILQGGSSPNQAIVQITSGTGDTYEGNVFGDGPDETATITGVVIKVVQISASDTLPVGAWGSALLIDDVYWMEAPICL